MAVDLLRIEDEDATVSETWALGGEEPAARVHPWLQRVGTHLGVIAVFTTPAVILWWRAWSVGAASTVRCTCLDPAQQVWFIAWPAYALKHGLSPFSSTWLWPPHGVDLLSNASAPLVGMVLTPITWWFGPLAATTVALTLAPGLSAWGCWVACRRLVTWPPACWVAGLVFGYSPFVVQSVAQGHLSTGLLVFPPLVLVVLHEIQVRQRSSVWWCGITLSALLLGQFLVSAEILAITVVLSVLGIVVTATLNPRRGAAQLPFALRAFGIAGLVSLVLLAGPVRYMLDGPERIKGPVWSGLHNFFVAQIFSLWDPGTYRSPAYIVVTDTGVAPTEAAAVFTAATGAVPVISHQAWVWDLEAHPLGAPYDAAAAASAYETCLTPTSQLGRVPSGLPLPQTLNLCVGGSSSA